jgi:hypothetical protein
MRLCLTWKTPFDRREKQTVARAFLFSRQNTDLRTTPPLQRFQKLMKGTVACTGRITAYCGRCVVWGRTQQDATNSNELLCNVKKANYRSGHKPPNWPEFLLSIIGDEHALRGSKIPMYALCMRASCTCAHCTHSIAARCKLTCQSVPKTVDVWISQHSRSGCSVL